MNGVSSECWSQSSAPYHCLIGGKLPQICLSARHESPLPAPHYPSLTTCWSKTTASHIVPHCAVSARPRSHSQRGEVNFALFILRFKNHTNQGGEGSTPTGIICKRAFLVPPYMVRNIGNTLHDSQKCSHIPRSEELFIPDRKIIQHFYGSMNGRLTQ